MMIADAKEKGTVRLDDYSMWIEWKKNDMKSGVGQLG